MSLTVETADSSFIRLVQDALTELCGCQSVAVDAVTGIVSTGPMMCACYCDHPAGCNLLTDLVLDARAVTIVYSASSSGYNNNDNVVSWYPHDETSFGDKDTCGGTRIIASIMLGHELVHARLASYNENQAVRGENQIRMERCMPMRTEYSLTPVPDFRVGVLDASIRPESGCGCFVLRGGLCASSKRWLCMLHSMYCVPITLSGWKTFLTTRMKRDA